MGQGPYGPGPIWARAHMGQGPLAPGPWAPGPSLLGEHLTKKRTLEKRVQIEFFVYFFGNEKDARRPYDHFGGGIAPRPLLCVRKRRFPFLKKDIFLSVICQFVNSPPGAGCERTPFAIKERDTHIWNYAYLNVFCYIAQCSFFPLKGSFFLLEGSPSRDTVLCLG